MCVNEQINQCYFFFNISVIYKIYMLSMLIWACAQCLKEKLEELGTKSLWHVSYRIFIEKQRVLANMWPCEAWGQFPFSVAWEGHMEVGRSWLDSFIVKWDICSRYELRWLVLFTCFNIHGGERRTGIQSEMRLTVLPLPYHTNFNNNIASNCT